MLRRLSNPYYWLVGFILGLFTGALVVTVLSSSFPVSGATLGTATGSSTQGDLGQFLFSNETADSSGTGSDIRTAKAWEGAGNEGIWNSAQSNADFIEASGDLNTGTPANSRAKFEFTLRRGTSFSDDTSDGAFTSDRTISVVLVRMSDDAPMATHFYGTSKDVLQHVLFSQTDPLNPFYETHFQRGDLIDPNTGLAPTGSGAYLLKVYVRGVDGNWMLQATSRSVTF